MSPAPISQAGLRSGPATQALLDPPPRRLTSTHHGGGPRPGIPGRAGALGEALDTTPHAIPARPGSQGGLEARSRRACPGQANLGLTSGSQRHQRTAPHSRELVNLDAKEWLPPPPVDTGEKQLKRVSPHTFLHTCPGLLTRGPHRRASLNDANNMKNKLKYTLKKSPTQRQF